MTPVWAIANVKGGVAKTTTAVSVAAAWVETGHRVLLVDLDPQACATFSLGIDPEDLPGEWTLDALAGRGPAPILQSTDGVDVVPATLDAWRVDHVFSGQPDRHLLVSSALAEIASTYDHVIIDCAPSLGLLTMNALVAATNVLIPAMCETLAHRGVGQVMEAIGEVRAWANPAVRVSGLLPTRFDDSSAHAQAIRDDLARRIDAPMLEAVPFDDSFAAAPAAGRAPVMTNPESPGAQVYRRVAQALLS